MNRSKKRPAVVAFALAHPGMTYAEIGRAMCVSEDWASACCRGAVKRTIGRPPRPLPPAVQAAVDAGLAAGESHATIAGRIGMDRSALSRRLKAGGHQFTAKDRRALDRRVTALRLVGMRAGSRATAVALGVTQRHANRIIADVRQVDESPTKEPHDNAHCNRKFRRGGQRRGPSHSGPARQAAA